MVFTTHLFCGCSIHFRVVCHYNVPFPRCFALIVSARQKGNSVLRVCAESLCVPVCALGALDSEKLVFAWLVGPSIKACQSALGRGTAHTLHGLQNQPINTLALTLLFTRLFQSKYMIIRSSISFHWYAEHFLWNYTAANTIIVISLISQHRFK